MKMSNSFETFGGEVVNKRIFLSPPHMSGRELEYVHQAFASDYIAPVGPQLDAFEKEFAKKVGARHAAAVSSGTAALHLALQYVGVGQGDDVFCSAFTFVASANPILYLGARPIFIDSDWKSWNLDPQLFTDEIKKRAAKNRLPKAVVLVHLYGQAADIDPIKECCARYGVALIEDAAEALGASYKGRAPGTLGQAGIYSFNGNKIITGSSGGIVVSDDELLIQKECGYNYRMSNIIAAICLGQLEVLDDRVKKKREIFDCYKDLLESIPGLIFMPEADYGVSNRWLSCITIDENKCGCTPETIRLSLEEHNIESRHLWKPMHLQPLFKGEQMIGGRVAEALFKSGLCLPSGTAMIVDDIKRITDIVKSCCNR